MHLVSRGGPGDERRVARDPLRGPRSSQEPELRDRVVERRDQFFDAGEDDVNWGNGGAEAAIAFIGNHHHRARLGDQCVGPGDAHPGGEERVANLVACRAHLERDVLAGYVSSQRGGHVGADLLPGQMHGRHHHVTWSLMAELNDPLPEIGFHYSETGVLGHMVEPNLLAHHRLRFRDQRDIVTPRDLKNDVIGSSRIAGSVDGHTGSFSRQAKLLEIRFQFCGDSRLRSLHTRLQCRKIDLVGGAVASRPPALLERGQIVRQLRIIKRAAKTLVELVRMVDWIGLGPRHATGLVATSKLVMTLNCTMARAWVHQQDSIDRARLCGTLAPELLPKFA